MIADALRFEIESHAQRTRVGNSLLVQARTGTATPSSIGRYLASVRYLIGHTQGNLARASERARETGRPELAAHYADKQTEEEGHERWAEDDLGAFVAVFGFRPDPQPVPAIAELQQFLRETIDEDPSLYLAYVFWAEYFVVLAGGELIEALVGRCGLPIEALTCLAKHVVLDEGHSDDDVEAIDRLVQDPRALAPLRATLRHATRLFDRACEEMVAEPARTERVAS